MQTASVYRPIIAYPYADFHIKMKRNCNNIMVFLVSPAGNMVYSIPYFSSLFEAACMKQMLSRPVGRFSALMLSAAALQAVFRLCLGIEGDAGALLLMVFLYIALPAASVLLPFWAGRGGVPAIAAFFPIGGAALVFSSVPPALCWACMALSLVAATAGQEILKRTESEKKDHHGRRNQKR